jgi:hypothetical protein
MSPASPAKPPPSASSAGGESVRPRHGTRVKLPRHRLHTLVTREGGIHARRHGRRPAHRTEHVLVAEPAQGARAAEGSRGGAPPARQMQGRAAPVPPVRCRGGAPLARCRGGAPPAGKMQGRAAPGPPARCKGGA